MLGDAIVNLFGLFAKAFGDGIATIAPASAIPQFVPTAIEQWSQIVTGMAAMSHWLPMNVIAQVVVGLVFAHTLALFIRIGRIVMSAGIGGGG
jgi:hypothetical protein